MRDDKEEGKRGPRVLFPDPSQLDTCGLSALGIIHEASSTTVFNVPVDLR